MRPICPPARVSRDQRRFNTRFSPVVLDLEDRTLPSSVVWTASLGGGDIHGYTSVAVDSDGDIYVGGTSLGGTFTQSDPAAEATFDSSGSGRDGFIAKLDPKGNVIWGKYLGADNVLMGLAVDPSGNVYATGWTDAMSAPLPKANDTNASDTAAFVAKFMPDGTLVWSTYIGGSGDAQSFDLAVDASGDALVAGETNALNFSGAPANNANRYAFVAKVGPDGTLSWAEVLNLSANDQGDGVATDANGNVYLSGSIQTDSPQSQAFVVKYDASGTQDWMDVLDGTSGGFGIAVDAQLNVLLCGGAYESVGSVTLSSGSSVSSRETDQFAGQEDAYVARFDPSGDPLSMTYLNDGTEARRIAADADGNAVIFGLGVLTFPGADTSAGNDFVVQVSKNGGTPLASLQSNEFPDSIFDGLALDRWGDAVTVDAMSQNDGPDSIVVTRSEFYREPVLIVPGIGGSFPTDASFSDWAMHEGVPASELVADPLIGVYNDLIQSFENQGYVLGQDLFVATYDWRLPLAPLDGTNDGHLNGLNAKQLGQTLNPGQFYSSMLDYLVYWLKQAEAVWAGAHPGVPLGGVNVIAHSMGGLLTRAYLQSNIYDTSYTDAKGNTQYLPPVDDFVMLDVPNQGAPKALNPLLNDWSSDRAYQFVLSKFANYAYQKVIKGGTIERVGTNGQEEDITLASITDRNGKLDPVSFIGQYVAGIEALSPTYPFLYLIDGTLSSINGLPGLRNDALLDLNADPTNAWIDGVSSLIDIYGDSIDTITQVVSEEGTGGNTVPLDKYWPVATVAGQIWYSGIPEQDSGDGTVPTTSMVSNFASFADPQRVTLQAFSNDVIDPNAQRTQGAVDHLGIVSNPDVQAFVLNALDPGYPGTIAQGGGGPTLSLLKDFWTVFFDPVQGVLVDANGDRLGYTQATGPLAEIPDSFYLGGTSGIGWVLGPLAGPPSVELTGLGALYAVNVEGTTSAGPFGVSQEGTLAAGSTLTLAVSSTADAPTIASLTAAPSTLLRGSSLTLTASGVADAEETVVSVAFYRDSAGTGVFDPSNDQLLGQSTGGAGGWTLTVSTGLPMGSSRFFAVATNATGASSAAAISSPITVVDAPPTIGSLSVSPQPLRQSATVILTASGVQDPGGTVTQVQFYLDANGNGVLDLGTDPLLGNGTNEGNGQWMLTTAALSLPIGPARFLARAQDDTGTYGDPVSAGVAILAPLALKVAAVNQPVPNDLGQYPAMVLDAQGNLHIAYVSPFNGGGGTNLYYASEKNGVWSTQVIDTQVDLDARPGLALDAAGNPHIAYPDTTSGGNDAMMYASFNGAHWSIQTVDTFSQGAPLDSVDLALDASGNASIAYESSGVGRGVTFATNRGGSWAIQSVDTDVNVSDFALAVDHSGVPHLAISGYTDTGTNFQLDYLSWNGSTWSDELVDSIPLDDIDEEGYGDVPSNLVGQDVTLVFDQSGAPHLLYLLTVGSPLMGNSQDYARYAVQSGGSWVASSVATGFTAGGYGLTVDATGRPHAVIFVRNTSAVNTFTIEYGTEVGGAWSFVPFNTVVDSVGTATNAAIAAEASGVAHVVYTINNVQITAATIEAGAASDQAPSDYDGDGETDPAVFRPSSDLWIINQSSAGKLAPSFGDPSKGDIPAPGDYDVAGKSDLAVFRPGTDQWIIRPSTGGPAVIKQFGDPKLGDVPVPGDYEGNGLDDLAIFRPSTDQWIIRLSSGKTLVEQFGDPKHGDIPVPGNYEENGLDDLAIFRPSTDQWIIRLSSGKTLVEQFGDPKHGDIPVPGDYDGDGKTDLAVFRPGTDQFIIPYSSGAPTKAIQLGDPAHGDVPPNAPLMSLGLIKPGAIQAALASKPSIAESASPWLPIGGPGGLPLVTMEPTPDLSSADSDPTSLRPGRDQRTWLIALDDLSIELPSWASEGIGHSSSRRQTGR